MMGGRDRGGRLQKERERHDVTVTSATDGSEGAPRRRAERRRRRAAPLFIMRARSRRALIFSLPYSLATHTYTRTPTHAKQTKHDP